VLLPPSALKGGPAAARAGAAGLAGPAAGAKGGAPRPHPKGLGGKKKKP
jgi:hypothetical protein